MDHAPAPPSESETVDQYARYDLPPAGFRNYWYPVIKAGRLGRKPLAVKLLGDDIVLFRDGPAVHALADRCPHRGAKLSIGQCQFAGSGTISCPYHGWTFRGDTGECVAAIMEGAESRVPGTVAVRPYPVLERRGIIWVYVGEMAPTPFEEDVPDLIADENAFFTIGVTEEYNCNWRLLTDKLDQRAPRPLRPRQLPRAHFPSPFPPSTSSSPSSTTATAAASASAAPAASPPPSSQA